jgi:hypothetical protein
LSVNVAEAIFESVPAEADVIDILARLVWMTPDNGGQIFNALSTWLISGDVRRAKTALNFDEVFLWDSDAEMEEFLVPLLQRFPSLKDDCNAARNRWRKQFPNN